MRVLRTKRGMTLVELVASTAIITIISVSLFAVVVHGLRGYSAGTSQQEALNSAGVALQKLSAEIRDGRSAVVQGSTLTVTFPALLSDPDTGERVYDINTNDPVTRSYYVHNGDLVRRVSGAVSVVARGVSSVEFIASLGTVRATLVGHSQTGSVGSTQSVSGMIALRNHRS